MYLKEIQAKGLFKTRIELVKAFKTDPAQNAGVKKAESEIASYTGLIAAYDKGPDGKALAEAREELRVWKARLADALAQIEKENEDLAELATIYAGEWILMREPRGEEVIGVEADGKPKSETRFITLFPECLIDWSMKRAENEKTSKEEILAVLRDSATLWAYVLNEWGQSLPLARMSGRALVSPLAR